MSDDYIQTLEALQSRVAKIPEDIVLPYGQPLSCHIVARAVLRFSYPVELSVVDGWYAVFEHSWLSIPGTSDVFDVYPVGTLTSRQGGAIFVVGEVARWLYKNVSDRKEEFRQEKEKNPDSIFDPNNVVSPVENPAELDRCVDFVARLIID